MIAGVVDVLQISNWQRGGDGVRPDPIPRPSDLRERELRRERVEARARRFLPRNEVQLAEQSDS